MANQDENERLRRQGEAAKDYFSKLPGFEQAQWQPAGSQQPPAADPTQPQPLVPERQGKPEAPLSDAEKYFKKLLG